MVEKQHSKTKVDFPAQLHYDIMCQNILDKLHQPLVAPPHAQSSTMPRCTACTLRQHKKGHLVANEWVLDRWPRCTHTDTSSQMLQI